jgi:hypothetical protein
MPPYFQNNVGGVENTRLLPSMNIQDRIARLEDALFPTNTKLSLHDNRLGDHDALIATKADLTEHKKVADIVSVHGNR